MSKRPTMDGLSKDRLEKLEQLVDDFVKGKADTKSLKDLSGHDRKAIHQIAE
eukprot:gene17480-769_t